jgi:hypothetical protein
VRLIALVLVAVLGACHTVRPEWAHDPSADFTKYRTYSWLPSSDLLPPEPIGGGAVTDERIRAAVERALDAKGLLKAANGADLLLGYLVGAKERLDFSRWSDVGSPGRKVDLTLEGGLLIGLMDAETRSLVWRGRVTGIEGNDEAAALEVEEGILNLLENYPAPR